MNPLARSAGWLAVAAVTFWSAGRALTFTPPSLDPTQAATTWEEAQSNAQSGRELQALSGVRKLLRSFPENHVYLDFEASLLQELGRDRSAARVWELYTETSPTPAEACERLIGSYRRQGALALAADAAKRCLGFDPTRYDLRVYYGLALEHLQRDAEAAAEYRVVLSSAPAYADARLGLARLALKEGHRDEARRFLAGLTPKDAGSSDALIVAAKVEAAENKFPEAIALLRRAAVVAPTYADVFSLLANFEEQSGQKEPAAKDRAEAERLNRQR